MKFERKKDGKSGVINRQLVGAITPQVEWLYSGAN